MAGTHPGVNLHVDGVQVLVGSPDVDVLDDGPDADALSRNEGSVTQNDSWC